MLAVNHISNHYDVGKQQHHYNKVQGDENETHFVRRKKG